MLLKRATFIVLIILLSQMLPAQRVGLVLSGGGASALAHVGVLRALEENGIPIDYITGTSMGAMVGALYACGYSPAEIEAMYLSESFRRQAKGIMDEQYIYHFKRHPDNASWITVKLALDSNIETSLPTNLVNPVPIDFSLMEMMGAPIAAAQYNFDSLMLPFRCLAADIENKKSIVFRNGDLGKCVRASMSYPFYLKPISIDGVLLFDGGIYNNFPSNTMYDEFFPDIIIGSNVSSNEPPPSEDNLISQLKTMLLSKTNFDVLCQNGIIIEPNVSGIGTFNFDLIRQCIDSGYTATLRRIQDMKKYIHRTVSPEEIAAKRDQFRKKQIPLNFDKINVSGINRGASRYVKNHLARRNKFTSVDKLRPLYFHLAADERIKQLYPTAKLNRTSGLYELNLDVKKEKELIAQVGGNFSNRPINMGFLSLRYNYLGRIGVSLTGNIYAGKLYGSAMGSLRLEFPNVIPFYFEGNLIYNRFDFFKSSTAFLETARPPYLIQYESFGDATFGFPAGNKGKLELSGSYAENAHLYYRSSSFTEKDTADRTNFYVYTAQITYERNTLNRKQYANEGAAWKVSFRYVDGEETFIPGSTAVVKDTGFNYHQWLILKVNFEKYFNTGIFWKPGLMAEGVFSGQTLFSNYIASVLAAPAFMPTPETKTLFLERFRAHKYAAAGVRNVFVFKRIFEFRLEGFYYLPYQLIVENSTTQGPEYSEPWKNSYIIANASLVANTPIGPVSVGGNYYHKEKEPFTFLFHFGYIIFNKRSLE
ncbi:MAG: patatin-like phospholipase family protein [Bacteroidia bacterium]|nr:patatin-like phospholipase family protein [Bacteroidia bacterium]